MNKNSLGIRKATIQHYRSLSNITVDFDTVTVLVGPNGSGKSNLIDVFRFLRDATLHGLAHAVDHRGGLSILRQYSTTRPYNVSIEVDLNTQYKGRQLGNSYGVRFSGTDANLRVESEQASWYQFPSSFEQRN